MEPFVDFGLIELGVAALVARLSKKTVTTRIGRFVVAGAILAAPILLMVTASSEITRWASAALLIASLLGGYAIVFLVPTGPGKDEVLDG